MSYAEAQFTIDEVLNGVKKSYKTGPEPNNLKGIKAVSMAGRVLINFEPVDTYFKSYAEQEEQMLASVTAIILRRKIGEYPKDENDGDLVRVFTGPELVAYKTNPYVDDNLSDDTNYYYRFFICNQNGMMNSNMVNAFMATPHTPKIWGFHQDFTVLDPAATITYIEENENYTPMMTNCSLGDLSYGSWGQWQFLKENVPYDVAKNGTPIKQLNPTNYNYYIDDTPSGFNVSSREGNLFAWLPKIYMKEVYAEDGNSRDVYFALERDPEINGDFIPVGFVDVNEQELEGIWLPMNYFDTNVRNYYNATLATSGGLNLADAKTQVKNYYGSGRNLGFLGGPIINVLRDLTYLLYKTTDIQKAAGYGSASYNKTYADDSTIIYQATRGGFIGEGNGTNAASRYIAKMFHSHVIGQSQRAVRDPYAHIVVQGSSSNYFGMTKNYSEDMTKRFLGFTDIIPGTSKNSVNTFPARLRYVGDGYGSIPDYSDNSGSTTTGLCDQVRAIARASTSLTYSLMHFGYTNQDLRAGMASATIDMADTATCLYGLVIPVLLPEPGFKPDIVPQEL